MSFEPGAQVPKTEFAYWAGAIRKWFEHGLPIIQGIAPDIQDSEPVRGSVSIDKSADKFSDKNVSAFFNLDSYLEKFPFDISPMLDKKIISENGDYKVYKDNFGITKKVYKKKASIPLVTDYPIKNRKDLNDYLEKYDFHFKKRLPDDFEEMTSYLKNRDYAIRLGGNPFGFSFLGRHLMGEVNFMLSLYDDPGLIKKLNGFYLNFVMNYFSEILENVEVDCAFILEDVAYRSGSFISEEMFREFMMPYYLEYIDFLHQYGVKNIIVDCDGLIDELIPLWVEAGITGIFPIEAVNDLTEIRKEYPEMVLFGGFDKRVLFADSSKREIDRELAGIEAVLKTGGYIPHIDHAVSQDVTWENFRYYRSSLNNIIDRTVI
jgi:uroporphyrinogen decarboxylase